MTTGINYLDLFSGIGGFAKGIQDAGIKIKNHYYSEIDKHCINLYEKHFPTAIGLGDISTIRDVSKLKDEGIGLVTFGFPCQDLSIAGKRAGIDGERSSLFFKATRIIKEIKPAYFIFENVKGLFSSNGGKDFKRCLQEITDIGPYDCEWQLVNTSWFLPQNRERIYFIGHLRERSRPKVFPFTESNGENIGIQRQQAGSSQQSSEQQAAQLQQQQAKNRSQTQQSIKNPNANTITSRYGTAESTGAFIVECELQKKTKGNPQGNRINTVHGNSVCLSANGGGRGAKTGLYAIGSSQKNAGILKDKSTSLTSAMGMGGGHIPMVIPFIAPDQENKRQNGRRFKENIDPSFTLTSQDRHGIYDGHSIRKLTPTECERLQGFPDNWTKTDRSNNIISDSNRYRMLGNAVTVKVVEEIMRRLFK